MKMPSITKITAREILDSRGNPTIEVDLYTQRGKYTTSVPSGASTGKHEAIELRDGGKRYQGLGVQKAIKNIEQKIAPKLIGKNPKKQSKIDQIMLKLDGTKNKSKLGANAILAVSLACAKAGAGKKPLYLHLNQLLGKKKPCLPRLFFNVINGGKHAGNKLAFQEFMISPKTKNPAKALQIGSEVYHALRKIIAKRCGEFATNVGDEGGFAPPVQKAEEVLTLIKKAIRKAGYQGKVDVAMDCAASEFCKQNMYCIPRKLSKEQLLEYYLKLIKKHNIISMEDPFEQEDFASFAELTKRTEIQIVGDDLTVTNLERIEKAITEKSCNCLLLKVNQIGTLTEALSAVRLAYQNNWKVMVSHRSGETEDTFIADLVVGIGCGQIKAGAPCRGERTAKYNRLVKIAEEL